jgi:DNA mismatch repair protein MutS
MTVTKTQTETPMLRQYREIKAQCEEAILFFRLGDFYEMFMNDAKVASKELEITLTGRGKDESRIPMCGIPYHAAESYILRLVSKGYKVAVCEQTEDASLTKGLTKREIVRIITPGTVIEQGALDAKENNYLVAVNTIPKTEKLGISFVDITTGEFKIMTVENKDDLTSQLERLNTKEVLISSEIELELNTQILISNTPMLDQKRAEEELLKHFKIKSLTAYGIDEFKKATPSAWSIIDYLLKTQKHQIPQITKISPYQTNTRLSMDRTTIRNLELTESLHNNNKSGTLFWILDQTKTAMGARYLKQLLKAPFYKNSIIENRLDAVENLLNDLLSREEIREILKDVYDLERLVSRIVYGLNNPKDCIALKESLQSLADLSTVLSQLSGQILEEHSQFFSQYQAPKSPYQKIINLIEKSIIPEPPAIIRDGNIINPGYSEELDRLLLSFKNIKDWIGALEETEKNRTGIKSLKVRFNKVFGYYIEIPNSQNSAVPDNYIRKQTLTNAERYITPELKEKETVLLNGEEKQKALETEIYQDIVKEIATYIPALQELAKVIADIDCLQSLATVSQKNHYTRPTFKDSDQQVLNIENGRHPVLEKNSDLHYIPNDINMSTDNNSFILITGPNMAGKSTLMRQVALTIVMAQCGCFVPASKLELSLVDKLFTRIGALDNLYSGQSTFMVEMLETATILHNATENSLIILDEIGRGTATFDGMSIAGSVTDYIHSKIKARTLFATHYHELTCLEKSLSGLSNFNMQIQETNDQIVFTYKLMPGTADKSYGIHVAEMAGLPYEVIKKAGKLLAGFELEGSNYLHLKHNSQQLKLF